MTEACTLLIRYDEIGLKGKNRNFFENCLLANIKRALSGIGGTEFSMPRGRILLNVGTKDAEECARQLKRIPGIASFSIGFKVKPDMDEISSLAIDLLKPRLKENQGLKFCVRTQRSDKSFPKTSPEINQEVGAAIMQAFGDAELTVSMKKPDCMLEVEIGHGETIVFDNRVEGIGGLPVGSAGEVLALLSGGIDSPVAAFMTVRRGCRAHSIFFDNRTYLGRGGFDKVVRVAKILNRYQGKSLLYVVPFQDIQTAIRDNCTSSNRVVLYRRMMYRIAHAVAEKNNYLGLVTGECLGQVASQTLENLAAVSCVVPVSVFQPLIGLDKKDIIMKAREIGTYDISIESQPDCCSVFMPDQPVTRSKVEELEKDESRYPWQDLMGQVLDKMEVIESDGLR